MFARSIRSFGDRLGKMAWHDPAKLTPEMWAGYAKPLQAENWDRALWQITRAGRDLKLGQRLEEITIPVLVVTGDDDRIVPTAQSIRLGGELPDATLVVIPNSGHVAHEESPAAFLEAVGMFIGRMGQ